MHVGTDCSWLDERTDLNNVVGTIIKSTALFIHDGTLSGNDEIQD